MSGVTKNNMDEDFYNTLAKEERVYQSWVREHKNRILSMTNTVKKQMEWNRLFPTMTRSDDYLAGNIF